MKILFVHASAGAGHLKAAEALSQKSQESFPHQVTFIDALDYTSPHFKRLYRGTYTFLVSYIPAVWGVVFRILDIPLLQKPVNAFRRIYNRVNTRAFHQYLIDENFTHIFTTHFMPVEVASALKRQGKISSKLITVVTDYDVHRIWINDRVDMFCVATEWTKKKVISLGVSSSKVHVTGIPTNEKFSKSFDKSLFRESFGLKPEKKTVLVATGSFGIGPIEEVVEQLKGMQVIVVCGHNKTLYEKLKSRNLPDVMVCALVDNMHELMSASDVMVTKPGGLSISEALVKELPMIFFNAIPGQETNNIKVLNQFGVGKLPGSNNGIVDELKKMNESEEYYQQHLENAKQLARPHAAQEILNNAFSL